MSNSFLDGSKETYRPNFKVAGLGPDIAANVAYKRAFQKSTFNKLLGSARLADRYINSNSYLSRGHLSPDQISSLQAGNLPPIFTSTSARNGKSSTVEIGPVWRELSEKKPNNLKTRKKLPVPKFTWKIMYNPKTQDGIVFVVVNNPFLDGIHEDDVLCTNVCEMYGWGTSSWNNIRKGYIYCCDVNDFADVVDTMPHFPVKRVLRGIS
ncbi:hypothetical protein JTB14_023592 [Gonioctena quinquepunctata]|nr:hypothetical protein JTB14_023592 [Gonioctena quinquepunctata]